MTSQEKSRAVWIAAGWAALTAGNIVLMPMRHSPHVAGETIATAPMALVVRAPGNLEAKTSVTLKAQFDGTLQTKNFHEGQKVKAGELLAVMSREKVKLDYQQKQDALTNAQSDLAQAKKEVKLQQTLYEKQAVAESAVEEAQRNLIKAQQALRAADQASKMEQSRWDSGNVVSPIDGTIVHDALGDDKSVVSGKEIVTIADVSEFTVKARVDELDLKRLAENLPADVRVQIYPDRVFKAHLKQIGSQPETPDSTSIPVVLTLDGTPDVLLRPKLTADVWIVTGQTSPVLSVPLTAINNADGTTRVWIIGLGQRLRARKVTLGQTTPDRVEVKDGLRPGDRVCATADPALAEGMRIRETR